MTNYIVCPKEFGFNTYLITNHMEDTKIVKAGEPTPDAKYIIRWGSRAHIDNGPLIINKHKALNEVCNKGAFRQKVSKFGLAPATFLNKDTFIEWTEKLVNEDADVPKVIVRPQMHSRSENIYLCHDEKSLDEAIEKCEGSYYISEYIPKDREYRVFIANGRPFIVAEKNHENKDDISWGCVDEGTLDYINWEDWPHEVVRVATAAFNLSSLDFAAVDIIVKNDKAYFLECNTAPEVWAYYGQCFAKVFNYMIGNENGRKRLVVNDGQFNWKNYIHPAMTDKAIVK